MDLALAPKERGDAARPGQARFVAATRAADVCSELRARRFLVAVPSSLPLVRGRLRQALEDAVEGALAMRGALPPNVSVDADLRLSIRDQVFRARALGTAGLVLALPRLVGAADERGDLDAADSAALAAWLEASRQAPIVVLLDEADRAVRALAPTPLADLVAESALEASRGTAASWGELQAHAAEPSHELNGETVERAGGPDDAVEAPSRKRGLSFAALRAKMLASGEAQQPAPAAEAPSLEPCGTEADAGDPIAVAPCAPGGEPSGIEPAPADALATSFSRPEGSGLRGRLLRKRPEPRPTVASGEPLVATPSSEMPPVAPIAAPVAIAEPLLAQPVMSSDHVASAERILGAAERRSFAIELDSARGPKPPRVIEQLFTTRYVPLLGAVTRGDADSSVRGVVDAWRTSFDHSYRESFAAMRVTGKRPPMVFDAPDIAAKIGRLNGARVIRLALIDAMSFDLGERMMDRLAPRVAGRAVCVERSLLWAALPTTTPHQIALLARGAEGLREGAPASEPENEVARGRAITTLRRERLGAREVMKLDCVEARLRTAGPAYDMRLEAIADEVAQVMARFIESLQARTLLFVFGDHGFRMNHGPDGASTGPASQGGASPEEVLVPGYAWLVGGVH